MALNVFNGKLPPYSACHFFELYQEKNGQVLQVVLVTYSFSKKQLTDAPDYLNWIHKVHYKGKDYRWLILIIIWLNLAVIDSSRITAVQPENPLYIASLQLWEVLLYLFYLSNSLTKKTNYMQIGADYLLFKKISTIPINSQTNKLAKSLSRSTITTMWTGCVALHT